MQQSLSNMSAVIQDVMIQHESLIKLKQNLEGIRSSQSSQDTLRNKDNVLENNKAEDKNRCMERLNHVDHYLLQLTNSVNEIAVKISNQAKPIRHNNANIELTSLSSIRQKMIAARDRIEYLEKPI